MKRYIIIQLWFSTGVENKLSETLAVALDQRMIEEEPDIIGIDEKMTNFSWISIQLLRIFAFLLEIQYQIEITSLGQQLQKKDLQLLTTVILHAVKIDENVIEKIAVPGIKLFKMKIVTDPFPKTCPNVFRSDLPDQLAKLTKNIGIEGLNPFVKSLIEIPHVHILVNELIVFKKTETELIACFLTTGEFISQNFSLMDCQKLRRIVLHRCAGTVTLNQVIFQIFMLKIIFFVIRWTHNWHFCVLPICHYEIETNNIVFLIHFF